MMHDAESLDPEMERLRKLEISRKLLLAILKKHWLLLVLCFFLVTAAGISLLAIETRLSPRRFETRVNLLYFPKKIAKIQSLDDRTLMQIFTRHSTYLKLCGELHLPGESVLSLIQSVEVTQHRRQTNLYTVTAADNRAEGAIQKANLFAELCIREYIAFRTDDLERHREVIMGRRLATQDALEKLHQEEAALNRSEMVTSPAEELVRLQKISADLKNAVGEARVKLINEKNKLEKVREKLKNANPAVFVHSRKIREFIRELERLDGEILSARQLYTERNPRLRAQEALRRAVAGKYADFLAQHQIGEVSTEALDTLEKLHREAEESAGHILLLSERHAALEQALTANQKQIGRMLKIIPEFKNIEDRRRILQETFRANEELLADLSYLQASMPNEVTQVERSSSVVEKEMFARKNIVIATTVGMLLSGLLAALVLSFEWFLGKITGWQEVSLYPELNLLGFLPRRLSDPDNRDIANSVADALYYNMQAVGVSFRVIFSGCMQGGETLPETAERIEWNYSLSGRKLFYLKITSFSVAPHPGGGDPAPENVSRRGNRGEIQVENVFVLCPSELHLLQNAVEKLQQKFDLVIIHRDDPLKKNSVFLRQMAQLCDGAVLFLGAGRTLRSMLRSLVVFAGGTGMKIMTVVSGESDMKSLTQREYYDI